MLYRWIYVWPILRVNTACCSGDCYMVFLCNVQRSPIGDSMDIFELLAIMCGMMLGVVAIIIIIGLVIGSVNERI